MNENEIFDCLYSITDEQAEFSDIGDDSDYEDGLSNSSSESPPDSSVEKKKVNITIFIGNRQFFFVPRLFSYRYYDNACRVIK